MSSPLLENARVDQKVLTVIDLHDDAGEVGYWLRKSPIERFEALEFLRQVIHSYDPDTARLPRFLTIIERSRD